MTPENQQSNDFIVPYCEAPVKLLYQDADILLVDKPSGLLSVPGRHPKNKDCLISRIQQDFPEARIVHRLDMDTSGIMVLALNTESHRHLSKQFEQRKTQKTYTAIVFGLIEDDNGSIELPIITDWPNRPLQKIDFKDGKHALTHYEVLKRDVRLEQTRLLLTPITGRSHQLRIHLAEINHPILGCSFYAHKEALSQANRLLLHATTLELNHPVTGELIKQNCPCPF